MDGVQKGVNFKKMQAEYRLRWRKNFVEKGKMVYHNKKKG